MKHTTRELERQLKALANRRRLAILHFLKEKKEATVSEIADELNLSIKATSKHLGVLAARDLVERDQRSREMFYRIALASPPAARHILSLL